MEEDIRAMREAAGAGDITRGLPILTRHVAKEFAKSVEAGRMALRLAFTLFDPPHLSTVTQHLRKTLEIGEHIQWEYDRAKHTIMLKAVTMAMALSKMMQTDMGSLDIEAAVSEISMPEEVKESPKMVTHLPPSNVRH
jgi:hypothetical protein